MTADVELLPCPFCGSAEHLHVEHLEGTTIHPAYRVLCDLCGASSRYTDRDFRAAWNTRANVAHATAAKDAEIEALRAALESLKAHRGNAAMNQAGIIKALSEVRDELGAEIHRLRAELEIAKGQAEFYRTGRNKNQQKAERLAEALDMLLPFTEHDDSCGDHDTYNNAAVPSCGCGLDSAREHVCSLLYPTAAQEGDHEQND